LAELNEALAIEPAIGIAFQGFPRKLRCSGRQLGWRNSLHVFKERIAGSDDA